MDRRDYQRDQTYQNWQSFGVIRLKSTAGSWSSTIDLIERLKLLAKHQNRSLNNFVETLLLDAAYREPNAETLAEMEEARSGALRDVPALNLSSIEAMEKSMGL